MQSTFLHPLHEALGARFSDFSGWHMPLHYGSQMAEHVAVRQQAGIFDVAHMGVFDVSGNDAEAFLRYLLANDVARCREGCNALYSCMLNEQGGVVDDLIVYRRDDQHYRCVVNAGGKARDWRHFTQYAQAFDVQLKHRDDLAILALQGPKARMLASRVLPAYFKEQAKSLDPWHAIHKDDATVACTGYTGEDGYECMLPQKEAKLFWQACMDAGVQPCGLGARDSLRLEVGYRLQGSDMHDGVSPLASGLGWTVAMKDARDFVGKAALLQEKASGPASYLQGCVLEAPGMLPVGSRVQAEGADVGVITSAGYSPSLKKCIAMARLDASARDAKQHTAEKRGKALPLRAVTMPFIQLNHKEKA